MTTFVLVHGAWHGAWCWERLTPELQRRGHRVVAPDLPIDIPAATFDDYAEVVAGAVGDADGEDLVAVGHSLGGHVLPWLAHRRPVRRLIYLAALVADPGRSAADQERADGMLNPVYTSGLTRVGDTTVWTDLELARSLFYDDCANATADAAAPRLRAQAIAPLQVPCALEELPPVPSTYVLCAGDQMLDPAWSRRVAKDRLGAAIVELPGGHSPFLSRPAELAAVLHHHV